MKGLKDLSLNRIEFLKYDYYILNTLKSHPPTFLNSWKAASIQAQTPLPPALSDKIDAYLS